MSVQSDIRLAQRLLKRFEAHHTRHRLTMSGNEELELLGSISDLKRELDDLLAVAEQQKAEANTEFIVRAVNSYDDLLAVVHMFLDIGYDTDDPNYPDVSEALDAATAVVNKTREL